MITITKERLLTIKQWRETYGPGSNVVLPAEEAEELARIALAALEVEPIGFRCRRNDNLGDWSYVYHREPDDFERKHLVIEGIYAVQPEPVVPEEISMASKLPLMSDQLMALGYVKGWNACRAAMLQGVEPASNHEELSEENGSSLQLRNLIRQRHAEWSDKKFGCVGPVGPLKHLSKEALEAAAEQDDLSEWADMQFLLWDAQRRAGISDAEITAAMEDKLKINMERQWPEPKDGEPRLHIKEPGNSPVTPDSWISCSDRMPDKLIPVMVMYEDGEMWSAMWNGNRWDDGTEYPDPHSVTHWREMPAAPQQEVK